LVELPSFDEDFDETSGEAGEMAAWGAFGKVASEHLQNMPSGL
jgi:hypothetical protein